MTPCFWAKRTRRSRARCISLASVGKVIAFSWTVVSTITCWKSAGLAAPVRVATARLSCKALLQGSPARLSCKALLQGSPARLSCKALLQGSPARLSCKALLQGSPARLSCKALLQGSPARLSCKALPDEGDQPLLAHPLAPARQRGTVKRGRVLEELFATEQLPGRGLDPTLAEHLI